jgi:surface antigen
MLKNPAIRSAKLRWLASVALLAAANASFANNLSFLKDTPITYMTPSDKAALNRAAQKALDTKQDGESLDWNNNGSGNNVKITGTVTPLTTAKNGDEVCRSITLVAIAKGQEQKWTPTACKKGGGDWKVRKQ